MAKILIVDDHATIRESLAISLRKQGHGTFEAQDGISAVDMLSNNAFDLVVTDLKMGTVDGLEVLKESKRNNPHCEVVMITAFGTIDTAIEAIKLGAYDYIQKPFKFDDFVVKINRALEKVTGSTDYPIIKRIPHKDNFEQIIIGNTPEILAILQTIEKISHTDINVLIIGESGTGKELIAKAIHEKSYRRNNAFITINCGAIPENLQESELFGFVKGAFTGATFNKKGLLVEAEGGTVFLDEIADTSLSTQVKLLRFLQNGEVRPVGSNTTICVNARLIAATNKDLEEAVRKGNFREDLYYRINVLPFNIPPLRERKKDIIPLANFFMKRYSKHKFQICLSKEAKTKLIRYTWSGNVRELENVIERAVTLCSNDIIMPADLSISQNIFNPDRNYNQSIVKEKSSLALTDIEKKAIVEELSKCLGNRELAARELGISRTTLWRKLKKYGIKTAFI